MRRLERLCWFKVRAHIKYRVHFESVALVYICIQERYFSICNLSREFYYRMGAISFFNNLLYYSKKKNSDFISQKKVGSQRPPPPLSPTPCVVPGIVIGMYDLW